jgi:hypothetical protein
VLFQKIVAEEGEDEPQVLRLPSLRFGRSDGMKRRRTFLIRARGTETT